MAQKKWDGVIEAVRYTRGGKIEVVRAYERHGVVWSDRIIIYRHQLSELLKQGKRFTVGERKPFLGSVFTTGSAVCQKEGHIFTEGQTDVQDQLTGLPVF